MLFSVTSQQDVRGLDTFFWLKKEDEILVTDVLISSYVKSTTDMNNWHPYPVFFSCTASIPEEEILDISPLVDQTFKLQINLFSGEIFRLHILLDITLLMTVSSIFSVITLLVTAALDDICH